MKIALFVPCLVNHFYPEIARDTLELLEKLGHEVSYPQGQTCCGQLMTNSGCLEQARASVEALGKALLAEPCDAVVAPAASCVVAARENLERLSSSQQCGRWQAKSTSSPSFCTMSPLSTPPSSPSGRPSACR